MLTNNQKAIDVSCLQEMSDCDTFFLDMYGLLWNGDAFYDGTLDFLKTLKEGGKQVVLLSNATVLSKPFIQSQAKKGLIQGVHYDDVITSGEAFFHVLENGFFEELTGKKDYRFYLLGTENKEMFASVESHRTDDLLKADCVYLSGLGAVTPEEGERIFKEHALILNKAKELDLPAVCANPDLTFMSKGKQVLVQGSVGRFYESIGGKVHWFGKPYGYIFDFALEKTGAKRETTIMVGDTVETDVLGGATAGLKTLLVTKTGITGDLLKQGLTLDDLYQRHQVCPTYTTNQFSHLTYQIRRNHVRTSSLTSKKILCL